jgi:ABC-type nitrate/sulfonate/bicarbonate transport system substrate-binding protein
VTPIATTEVLHRILTRTDTGIRQVADLRGKKITTMKGTATDFTLYAALLRSGLSLADVELIDAVPTAAAEMLRDHAVDAAVLWEPHTSRVEGMLQQEAVRLATAGLYRSSFNLVVRNAFAAQHPEAVERVVRAMDAAMVFMHQHQAHAYQITAEWLRPYAPLTEAAWNACTFTLTLDQAWLTTLEDIARWAIRHHLPKGTRMPNILSRIYFDALEHGQPDAIMLIR